MTARTPTLLQWEAGPFNQGMNISTLPSDIGDDQAVIVQDMFLDQPGLIYTRGSARQTVNPNALMGGGYRIRGLVSATAPDGATHFAAIVHSTDEGVIYFMVLSDDGGSILTQTTIDQNMPANWDVEVDAKPALGGGVWIGINGRPPAFSIANRQLLFHWRGAVAYPGTAPGTITSTLGSTIVQGTGTGWTALNVTPGCFLTVTGSLVLGVVRSIDVATQRITLEANAAWAFTGAPSYALVPVRAFGLEVAKGRIKVASGQTAVLGSGTKFGAMGLDGNWTIYRAKDNAFIGRVSAVATGNPDEGLTLVANCPINVDNEPYVARTQAPLNAVGNYLLPPASSYNTGVVPGTLNVTYAQLQWFARQDSSTTVGSGDMHSRVWFSDYANMFALDMLTTDGDFIQVPSSAGPSLPIRALASTAHALLIFKENETFVLSGDNPDDFALQKLWDDGCISMNSVIQYHGAVIWAGRNGIYIFDGSSVQDLTGASLGNAWSSFVRYFDPRYHRMNAATYQDHYFLSIITNASDPTSGQPIPLYTTVKNQATPQPRSQPTLCVYIPTRAVSVLTAPLFWGYAQLNSKTFYATGQTVNAGGTRVGDFDTLFSRPVNIDYAGDVPLTVGGSYTPDSYIETKRYSMKDPLRRKMFKQVICTLDNNSDNFKVEVAPGLADSSIATTFVQLLPTFINTTFKVATARVKFLKRDRHIGLKFYCTNAGAPIGYFKFRRLAIGFKWQKIGRI